jgi:hypothetical protein
LEDLETGMGSLDSSMVVEASLKDKLPLGGDTYLSAVSGFKTELNARTGCWKRLDRTN